MPGRRIATYAGALLTVTFGVVLCLVMFTDGSYERRALPVQELLSGLESVASGREDTWPSAARTVSEQELRDTGRLSARTHAWLSGSAIAIAPLPRNQFKGSVTFPNGRVFKFFHRIRRPADRAGSPARR
jgi:hypothetical protein